MPAAATAKPHAPSTRRNGRRARGVMRTDGRSLIAQNGLGGAMADSMKPMRSWPYWFQIGLRPLVNAV